MGAPATVGRASGRAARRAANAVGRSRWAERAARVGMVARAAFYVLLAALTVDVAVGNAGSSRQADSHGALAVVAGNPLGWAAIAVTAAGFLLLGLVRLAGAIRDREESGWRRLGVAAQGVFYVGLTALPVSFLLGDHSAGSTGAQRSETARLLGMPGGPVIVAILGGIVIGVCVAQCWYGLTLDFTDGLDLRRAPRWVERAAKTAGAVGLVARGLIFLPLGIFLIVAAVQTDPQHAQSLDTELATVARQPWGEAVLALVALGLLVFAAYSLIDARYRKVSRAR